MGNDGCVFPVLMLGNLHGALVCCNRPGEYYALDERKLLTEVASEFGAALRILHARDNEAIVAELLVCKVTTRAIRQRAKALAFTPQTRSRLKHAGTACP